MTIFDIIKKKIKKLDGSCITELCFYVCVYVYVNGVCYRIEFSRREDLLYTRAIHYYYYNYYIGLPSTWTPAWTELTCLRGFYDSWYEAAFFCVQILGSQPPRRPAKNYALLTFGCLEKRCSSRQTCELPLATCARSLWTSFGPIDGKAFIWGGFWIYFDSLNSSEPAVYGLFWFAPPPSPTIPAKLVKL